MRLPFHGGKIIVPEQGGRDGKARTNERIEAMILKTLTKHAALDKQ
jgi:hypothetical protein